MATFIDALGNDVKVGDAVIICTAANYSAFSVLGVVEKFTPKKFVVKNKYKYTDWRTDTKKWKVSFHYYDQDSSRVLVVNDVKFDTFKLGYDPFDFSDVDML